MRTSASPPPRRFLPYGGAIFLAALTVRLVHVFQIRRAPFFGLMMGDAQSYHVWAQQIARGDWIGSGVFYQAPLYPYFLGVVYALFGEAPLTVRLCQAVIGSLACVLLAFAAWRLFSTRAAVAAGLMLAFYAPAIFFDGLIQKSVLDAFLLCLLLALLSTVLVDRPSADAPRRVLPTGRAWLWVGVTLGLLTLTRENAVVLAAAVLLWLLRFQRRLGSRRLAAAAWLVAGLALVLAPVAARNKIVGGELMLTTAQFGPNFYIGNHEGASGTYQPLLYGHGDPAYERQDATDLAQQATGRSMTPAEVSRYWTRRALDDIRTQPGDWLRLTGRKILLAANAAEVADTEDQLSYADWSMPLRVTGWIWHFGFLAPLAVLGMWAAWARRSELALLYLLPAAYALALVAFAIMARYRYPLVPFLILFASAGVANIGRLRQAAPRRLAPWLLAIILVAVFCNWPVYSMKTMRSITDANVGTELQAQGRVDEAIALYRAALARDPDDALTYSNLGTALAAKGELDEAIAQYRTALRLAPNDADSHYNLANALMARGNLADAAGEFREALRIDPTLADAQVNLGNALTALGQTEEAAAHYRQAIALRPDNAAALDNLGLILAGQGRFEEAIGLYQRALAIQPDFADAQTNLASAHNELGVMLAQQNQLDAAIGEFREAIRLAPALAESHANLAMALQIQGRLDEAIQQYQEATRLAPENRDMERQLQAARAAR